MEEERANVVEQLLNPSMFCLCNLLTVLEAKMRGNDKSAASTESSIVGSTSKVMRGKPRQHMSAVDRIIYGALGTKILFSGERDRQHPMPMFFLQTNAQGQNVDEVRKERRLCGAPGCSKEKRFNDSKTGTPICSTACYKIVHG